MYSENKYLLLISANPNPGIDFQNSELQISKVGFPIRKFTDQCLFAAPRDLSQRTTSFIASQRQGIHRTPLRHLIALIIEDRSERLGSSFDLKDHLLQTYPRVLRSSETHAGRSLPLGTEIPSGRLDMFPLHDDRQRAHPAFDRREPCRMRWKRETFRTSGSRRYCGRSTFWWSQTGSNRRPHACKARALPTELWPRRSEWRVANSERRR